MLSPDHADVPGLLHSLLEGIRGGDFHAEPDECKYCTFDRLCDKSRKRIRERKASDPRAVAFSELSERHP